MNEVLDFDDLTPIEQIVRINKKPYILREASEDAAVKYRNAGMKGARFVDGKLAQFSNPADVEPLLVSLCLFEQYEHGDNKETRERPVDEKTVRRWPSRMVKKLFERIVEISGLKDEEETQEALEKHLKDTQEKLDKLRKKDVHSESEDSAKND